MTGRGLLKTYLKLREIGITRSKRDFSTRWLGHGKTYLRDFEFRDGREGVLVPSNTVARLQARLRALADRMPAALSADIEAVISGIDRAVAVTDLLARRAA
jgi:hypothetical protein